MEQNDGGPAWGDAGIIMTWHIYRMYGDTNIIKDNYEAMENWVHYIESSNPTFIWKNKVNNNIGDWLSVNSSTPKEVVSTAYYAYDSLLLSKMANALGKETDAEKYYKLYQNIAKAFNKEFVNQISGKINGDTQTCYVLALAFKLLSDEMIYKAAHHLVDDIKSHNWHVTTGFVGKFILFYYLPAARFGFAQVVHRMK